MARTNGNGATVVADTEVMDDSMLLEWFVMGEPFSANWNDIPVGNRIAYFKRGVKHALQNEVAAGAGTRVVKALNIGDLSRDAKSARLQVYREENADEWKSIIMEEAAKRWNELMNGDVSADDRVRVDPYTRILNDLLDKEIRVRFRGAKGPDGKALSPPTNDTDTVVFANGDRRTRLQLRETILGQPIGEELQTNARAAADALKAGSKSVAAPVEPVSDPAALGF